MSLIAPHNAKSIKAMKKKKGIDPKVIDYFTKEGCMSGIMKDSEWDARVRKTANGVSLSEALDELGIDEDDVREIKPARLYGPKYMEASDSLHKWNQSGKYVSAVVETTWVLFGDEQLYVFDKQTDLSGLNESLIQGNEFFYKDVVSIATKQEIAKVGKKEIGETITFFVLTVPGDQIRCSMTEGQDRVQAMKQKLREKKRS